MKTLLLLFVNISVIVSNVIGQTAVKLIQTKADCNPVTIRMLDQHVHLAKQLDLQEDAEGLALINYKLANSYTIEKGQMVLKSQLLLIDIGLHEHQRMLHSDVKVYDEYSGLTIVLKSVDKMNEEMQEISRQYQLATNK
jgi:hypothetical protein